MNPATSKSLYVAMTLALFAAAVGLLLSGCAGLNPVQSKTVTLAPAQTNYVQVVATKTNLVVTTNTVAGKPVPVTNAVLVMETNTIPVITPAVTYQSNFVAAPWQTAVSTVGAVAPLPWAGAAVTGLFTLSTVVLGWMNRRNAAKAQASLTALDEANIVAETLVDNFEALRKSALEIPAYRTTVDPKVMDAVKLAQRLAGVKGSIDKLVDERTENTL